jgi:hypothetical protein
MVAAGLEAGGAHLPDDARRPEERGAVLAHEAQAQVFGQGNAQDAFGASVSVHGDTLVVGSPGEDTPTTHGAGAVYVFVRSGAAWSLQQKLWASDGAAGDVFGVSVSVYGDTVAVGALLDDTRRAVDAGSAYVFVRSGTTWTQQRKLQAPDGTTDARFGDSVSINADTLVVGSPLDDTPGEMDAGSAYVFVRSGTGWSLQQKLLASDGAAHDQLGDSVCVSGDTVVIGAYDDDTHAGTDAGSAYVFVRSGSAWSQAQKLVASDGRRGDLFGIAVSVSGDTLAVGAAFENNPGGPDAGAAYVFVRSGTTWSEQQKLVASDGSRGDRLGINLSAREDALVVGAYLDDARAGPAGGSAYLFVRSGTHWIEQQKLVAPDGMASDWFGTSVGLSGGTVVVGAPFDDTPGGLDAGSAHVFHGVGQPDG